MNNNFLLKAFFAILFCGSALMASANDVYVSTSGNDSNDGTSATTAYATLGKALTAVEDGGTIHVSGLLFICDDPANQAPEGEFYGLGFVINKNVTIQGSNKTTDGFLGFNEVTWMLSRAFRLNSGVLTLKNLTIRDCMNADKAGAIHVNGGALIAENVIFEKNVANGGSNQPNGGAIQVDKTTGVSFKNCLFKNNESAKGGVFYIQDTQNPSVELRFESCSFIGNKSTQGGASCSGLFFRLVSEGPTINIINCTFSGNSNAGNGGTVYVYGAPASATFNIINTTIVDNIGTSGGGSGAGINVESQSDEARKAVMNIRNSIIEGNAVASGATAEDLALGYEPTSNKLQISNSFIGKVFVFGAGLVPAESYTNSALYWDYMTRSFDRNEIQSGIDAFNGNYNVYPLTAGSPALTYGNASFLQNIGISTDAIGRTRSFADGKCSVGAMEGAGIPAGIQPVELQSNIQLYQEDNLLILKSLKSLNSLELINLSGQIIAKKSGNAETLTLPVDYLQGVYIARIVSGNKVYTQKIIIK